MADLVFECVRDGRLDRLHTRQQFQHVASRLMPTNISPRPARLIETRDLRAAVVNPSEEGVRVAEGGVLLGGVIGEAGHWRDVGSEPPDGTYVLVRYSGESVELLSDMTSSRTLWYALDEERLVVSTSQRAVVTLLGDFELDRAAVSWLLTRTPRTRLLLGRASSAPAPRLATAPRSPHLAVDPRPASRGLRARRPQPGRPSGAAARRHRVELRLSRHRHRSLAAAALRRHRQPRHPGVHGQERQATPAASRGRPASRCRNPLSDAFIARLVARRFGVEHDLRVPGERAEDRRRGAPALCRGRRRWQQRVRGLRRRVRHVGRSV